MPLYEEYKYVYPPRPEFKVTPDQLDKYDNGEWLAQPKYNGSCCNLFLDGKGFIKVMGREKEELSLVKHDMIDFQAAHRGNGFMILSGELLNKNKNDENGKPFNQKLILWDILAIGGNYMIGATVEQRLQLLENLFPCNRMAVTEDGLVSYDHICTIGIKGVYKAPTYTFGFKDLYHKLVKTDLYEGLVIKKKNAKLEYGFSERNNHAWQFKCRKATKNYHF